MARLGAREFRRHHGEPHGLLLEQRHPHGLAEHLIKLVGRSVIRMGEGKDNGLLAATAAKIRVDHVALNGAWSDDGDLDDEIVETAGLEPAAACSSAPGSRPGTRRSNPPAEHVVDEWIVARHSAERDVLAVMRLQQRKALRMQVSMPRPSTSTLSSRAHRDRPCPIRLRCGPPWRHCRWGPPPIKGRASARSRRHAGRDDGEADELVGELEHAG